MTSTFIDQANFHNIMLRRHCHSMSFVPRWTIMSKFNKLFLFSDIIQLLHSYNIFLIPTVIIIYIFYKHFKKITYIITSIISHCRRFHTRVGHPRSNGRNHRHNYHFLHHRVMSTIDVTEQKEA